MRIFARRQRARAFRVERHPTGLLSALTGWRRRVSRSADDTLGLPARPSHHRDEDLRENRPDEPEYYYTTTDGRVHPLL
jgi:hypothetical protein